MKLLLISPLTSKGILGADFYFRMPTLGLLKVAAATPPGWTVKIVDEKVEPLDLEQEADLVGITAMTPSAHRAYEIAGIFRARGVPVVMGGMHATMMPGEALAHCDAVVVGEAEVLWPRLLADLAREKMERIYRQDFFPSLAGLRNADWSLYRDKRYLPMHCVETTRGCPHGCDFCSVTNSFGGRFRCRPVEEVEKEIQGLRPFEGRFILHNVVLFVDDNIIGNKEHARELLRRIMPYRLQWLGQTSTAIAGDDELLRLCRDSGCMGLLIGFETLSRENLATVRKGFNRPHEYIEVIHKIHDYGIGVSGAFVFGLDGDDPGVFDRTYDFVQRARLEHPYLSILTPYPGTRLHERLSAEGRIFNHDWSNYNTNNVVFRPKGMTPDQLFEGYYRLQNAVHTVPAIVRRFWGTTCRANFWLPLNYGFRKTIKKLTDHSAEFRAVVPPEFGGVSS